MYGKMMCENLIGSNLTSRIQKWSQKNDWRKIGGVIGENFRINIENEFGLLSIMSK